MFLGSTRYAGTQFVFCYYTIKSIMPASCSAAAVCLVWITVRTVVGYVSIRLLESVRTVVGYVSSRLLEST